MDIFPVFVYTPILYQLLNTITPLGLTAFPIFGVRSGMLTPRPRLNDLIETVGKDQVHHHTWFMGMAGPHGRRRKGHCKAFVSSQRWPLACREPQWPSSTWWVVCCLIPVVLHGPLLMKWVTLSFQSDHVTHLKNVFKRIHQTGITIPRRVPLPSKRPNPWATAREEEFSNLC